MLWLAAENDEYLTAMLSRAGIFRAVTCIALVLSCRFSYQLAQWPCWAIQRSHL